MKLLLQHVGGRMLRLEVKLYSGIVFNGFRVSGGSRLEALGLSGLYRDKIQFGR
ncbi:MAG: hypothetical protein JXB00_17475 [Bacteroidales bacterium]|nr:hypothetical protein [Bacteroidales bacterium]